MLVRCTWCRNPFDTDEQPRTQQELGQLKTKLMIPDVAQPVMRTMADAAFRVGAGSR